MEARVGAPVGAPLPNQNPTEGLFPKHISSSHSSVKTLRLGKPNVIPVPSLTVWHVSLALHGSSGSSPALVIHLPFCGQRYQPQRQI